MERIYAAASDQGMVKTELGGWHFGNDGAQNVMFMQR